MHFYFSPILLKTNFLTVDGNLNTKSESEEGVAYLVVASGDTLSGGVGEVETSSSTLDFGQVLEGKDPGAFVTSFTLEAYIQVFLGLATTQADGSPAKFANITTFELNVM